nr:MAG TPA: hypothetical protein [Caudoviricetes sp.]
MFFSLPYDNILIKKRIAVFARRSVRLIVV